MVVPFEDNKYNTKEIYVFGLFYTYMRLSCYRLRDPIYHLYRTPLLYEYFAPTLLHFKQGKWTTMYPDQ